MDYAVGILIRHTSMSDDDYSTTITMELRQILDNLSGILRVEIASRFVCQNDSGAIE